MSIPNQPADLTKLTYYDFVAAFNSDMEPVVAAAPFTRDVKAEWQAVRCLKRLEATQNRIEALLTALVTMAGKTY